MAYVSQKVELFKGSIRSNLTLGMEETVSDQELWQALEIAQAKDFVSDKEGQLDAEVQAGGRNFSGGQKQRLSIARQSCVEHHSSSWMMRLRLLILLLSPIF